MIGTQTKEKKEDIPNFLIYEMDEGQPLYYQNYKDVLNKTKTAEQIMGSSILQSLLILLLQKFFLEKLGTHYLPLSNELGLKFGKKSWRNLDLALYDKRKIKDLSVLLSNKYIEISPELVIEVDTKVALEDLLEPTSYFQKKNRPTPFEWS